MGAKKVDVKGQHRELLIEYLSNPDNPPLGRLQLGTDVLGFANGSRLYAYFSALELAEIETEALEFRRKQYAAKLAQVDQSLLDRAIRTGDPATAKLAYQRFEGWSEKTVQEVQINGAMFQQLLMVLPPEFAERVKCALVAKFRQMEAIDV